MKKKSLLILTMVTLLCFTSVVQALAVGENVKPNLISVEEYTNRMTELFNKYDLKFEVLDASNYNPITRDAFESELNEIESNIVNAVNISNENEEQLLKLHEENEISAVGDITPYAMEIQKELKSNKQFVLVTGLAWVTIEFTSASVYNGSNGEFISVQNPGLWYKKLGINCTGIDYDRKEFFISSARTQVTASAAGIISYEYVHPDTGISISAEQPFSILKTFTVNS